MEKALCSVALLLAAIPLDGRAESPRALPSDRRPNDERRGPPRTLEGFFPFTPVRSPEDWTARIEQIRRQILLSAGLWPMPSKTPLNSVIHGKIDRNEYSVEKVIFESVPGHFVTGNLYRPKKVLGNGSKIPAVLCPHGHWPKGRFLDQDEKTVRQELATGAERWETAAHHPLQARCVQLARMGCIVFHYDMVGYADSIQFTEHTPTYAYERAPQLGSDQFFTVDADGRLQTVFGLQTWNSIRSVDFLLSLPEVDPHRIGITGASGGGTQAMILTAIDLRLAASFPCVMVSTAMQGGCTCENGHYLRIGMGNIDIAAATAPRPLGMTAADDWTK